MTKYKLFHALIPKPNKAVNNRTRSKKSKHPLFRIYDDMMRVVGYFDKKLDLVVVFFKTALNYSLSCSIWWFTTHKIWFFWFLFLNVASRRLNMLCYFGRRMEKTTTQVASAWEAIECSFNQWWGRVGNHSSGGLFFFKATERIPWTLCWHYLSVFPINTSLNMLLLFFMCLFVSSHAHWGKIVNYATSTTTFD